MMILKNKIFTQNLIRLRGKSELSQYELVEKMQLLGSSMSRSTYSKIELGLGNIKVSDLVALKEIYGVDYDDFFKDVDVSEKKDY
ncbi:MAG: helix-turn-helix transcriptional regulator [Clostridiales bacterium]|nr:helix-turn-helix transcriptional regulator [Clostridiales bacterium]